MVVRVNDKCIKLWANKICIGDKVRVSVRRLAFSEWINGVIRELRYGYMTIESNDGLKYVRYPMVESIKVIQYERK